MQSLQCLLFSRPLSKHCQSSNKGLKRSGARKALRQCLPDLNRLQFRFCTTNNIESISKPRKSFSSTISKTKETSHDSSEPTRQRQAARALRGLIAHARIYDALSFCLELQYLDREMISRLLGDGTTTEVATLYVDFALALYKDHRFYVHQSMFRPAIRHLFRFKRLDLVEKMLTTFAEHRELWGRGPAFLMGDMWSHLIQVHAMSHNVDSCIRLLKQARAYGIVMPTSCIDHVLTLAEDHKHEELIEAACSSLSVNEAALLFARIDFHISASQWQKALETLKKLEARSAEFSTRVSRQMVAALTGLNRLEEAEAYYKKHLQNRLSLDSQLWTSYRTIFGVLVAGRQLDKALATLDEMLRRVTLNKEEQKTTFFRICVPTGSPAFIAQVQELLQAVSPYTVELFQAEAAILSQNSADVSTRLRTLAQKFAEDVTSQGRPSPVTLPKLELVSFLVERLLEAESDEATERVLGFFSDAGFDHKSPKFWTDIFDSLCQIQFEGKKFPRFTQWSRLLDLVHARGQLPQASVSRLLARLSRGLPGSDEVLTKSEFLNCLNAIECVQNRTIALRHRLLTSRFSPYCSCAEIVQNAASRRRADLIRLVLPIMIKLITSKEPVLPHDCRDVLLGLSGLHLTDEIKAFWTVVLESFTLTLPTLFAGTTAFSASLMYEEAAQLALHAMKLHQEGKIMLDRKYTSYVVSAVIMPNISRAMRQDKADGHPMSLTSPRTAVEMRKIPRNLAPFVEYPASLVPLTPDEVSRLEQELQRFLRLRNTTR